MKSNIPSFVIEEGKSEKDWIENQDRLSTYDNSLPFNQKNQLDWWKQNIAIREHFRSLEKIIKANKEYGKANSVRLVSWMQMAKVLKCDRGTLKHPKRYDWVNNYRLDLLALITQSDETENTYSFEEENRQLKASLMKQREETSRWYLKYLEANERIEELNRLLLKISC